MKEITEQPDSNFNQTKEPEQLNKTTELNINKSDQPIHTIDNVYAHSNTCTFDMCENGIIEKKFLLIEFSLTKFYLKVAHVYK